MQTGLVRECRRANVRRLRVHRPIQYLGNKVAYLCQSLQAAVGQARVVHFQLQVWNDGGQVGVTRSLAQAIEGALHVTSTALHGGQRVGDCATRVVVTMDADRCIVTDVLFHCCNNVEHFVRKRSAVRVAQHQVRCAVDDCGL